MPKLEEPMRMEEFYEDNSGSKLENSTHQQDMSDFELEATTIWSFPNRGKWATHKGDYRGIWINFSLGLYQES